MMNASTDVAMTLRNISLFQRSSERRVYLSECSTTSPVIVSGLSKPGDRRVSDHFSLFDQGEVPDRRSTTRILDVMLKTPPWEYIFSLPPLQSLFPRVGKSQVAHLVPTFVISVLTTLSPLALGDMLITACSARAACSQSLTLILRAAAHPPQSIHSPSPRPLLQL